MTTPVDLSNLLRYQMALGEVQVLAFMQPTGIHTPGQIQKTLAALGQVPGFDMNSSIGKDPRSVYQRIVACQENMQLGWSRYRKAYERKMSVLAKATGHEAMWGNMAAQPFRVIGYQESPPRWARPIQLQFTADTGKVENQLLNGSAGVNLGCADESPIKIDAKGVESLHATIYYKAGRYWIMDHETRSGTFVAGKKIQPSTLVPIENEMMVCLGRSYHASFQITLPQAPDLEARVLDLAEMRTRVSLLAFLEQNEFPRECALAEQFVEGGYHVLNDLPDILILKLIELKMVGQVNRYFVSKRVSYKNALQRFEKMTQQVEQAETSEALARVLRASRIHELIVMADRVEKFFEVLTRYPMDPPRLADEALGPLDVFTEDFGIRRKMEALQHEMRGKWMEREIMTTLGVLERALTQLTNHLQEGAQTVVVDTKPSARLPQLVSDDWAALIPEDSLGNTPPAEAAPLPPPTLPDPIPLFQYTYDPHHSDHLEGMWFRYKDSSSERELILGGTEGCDILCPIDGISDSRLKLSFNPTKRLWKVEDINKPPRAVIRGQGLKDDYMIANSEYLIKLRPGIFFSVQTDQNGVLKIQQVQESQCYFPPMINGTPAARRLYLGNARKLTIFRGNSSSQLEQGEEGCWNMTLEDPLPASTSPAEAVVIERGIGGMLVMTVKSRPVHYQNPDGTEGIQNVGQGPLYHGTRIQLGENHFEIVD